MDFNSYLFHPLVKASIPVIALPTINECMSFVP